MARGAAFNAYVKGYLDRANGFVHWEGLVLEMKELTGATAVGLVESYCSASYTLASNWARDDLDAAMAWYAGDAQRDLRNPRHSLQVASVLGSLPPGEVHRAVDWIAGQLSEEASSAILIENYSKQLILRSDVLSPDTGRLLGLVPDEGTRAQLVGRFVVATDPKTKMRKFEENHLKALIDAGGFSDSQRSDLLQKLGPSN